MKFLTTQRKLKRKYLIPHMVEYIKAGGDFSNNRDKIRIYVYQGEFIVVDGHHRVVAYFLAGKYVPLETCQVEFVNKFNKVICGTIEKLSNSTFPCSQ